MAPHLSIEEETGRRNLRFLLGLRAVTFCAQILAIFACTIGLGIVLPVADMVLTASLLVLFNLYSFLRLREKRPIGQRDVGLGLGIDVVVLALQMNFSGGTSNPFVSFFMLPVILGAVMLSARQAWMIYALTLLCYAALAVADLYRPMPPPMPGMLDRMALHMHGMMRGYAVCAAVLVFMISRVRANLRARDEEITRLRTQALEQDHLMRLGLLTAGAAHELGTPLTTMSVIIKDWQDLGIPRTRAERDGELGTLDAQLLRCKAVISALLAASGRTRGEDMSSQALKPFLAGICEDWRKRRPDAALDLRLDLDDRPIAADKVLEQSLVNLLDNAYEASQDAGRREVAFTARLAGDRLIPERLIIEIGDRGPGFAPEILAALGKPFVTTKDDGSGRPRGLGLFLARNTAQAFGGELSVSGNGGGDTTGARVRLDIPLASIGVGDGD